MKKTSVLKAVLKAGATVEHLANHHFIARFEEKYIEFLGYDRNNEVTDWLWVGYNNKKEPVFSKTTIRDAIAFINRKVDVIKTRDDFRREILEKEQAEEAKARIEWKTKTVKYRILRADYTIVNAGTDSPSFFSLEDARKLVNYDKGEMIHEYDGVGCIWQVY